MLISSALEKVPCSSDWPLVPYVTMGGLEFLTHLPPPAQCLAYAVLGMELGASQMLGKHSPLLSFVSRLHASSLFETELPCAALIGFELL